MPPLTYFCGVISIGRPPPPGIGYRRKLSGALSCSGDRVSAWWPVLVTWSTVAVFTRTDLPGERQVYRTSGSLVAWWAWVAFAVVLLTALALGHHDHAALVTAAVVIAITGIMYACALRPRIVAGAAGITVVNPLRVHKVPWPAVTRVDLVHNVRVHYRGPSGGRPGGGKPGGEKIVHSWAVQSTGRSRTRSELRARRAARRGMTPEPGYARLPDAAQAALDGSAAEFIARQLDERARVQRSAAAGAPAVAEGRAAAGESAPGPGRAAAGESASGAGRAAAGESASAADAGSGSAPDAAPATAQVRWSWGPIAAMVVPLLILLALTLA